MLSIVCGLGAAAAWATSTLCASRASRLISVGSLTAWVTIVGMLVAGPAVAIVGIPPGLDAGVAGWLVVSGAGNVIGLLLAYSALRIGKVGLVAPITSTEGAVAALLAIITGERLAPGVGATLGVIAIGVALAAAAPASSAIVRRVNLRAGLLAGAAAISFGAGIYATGRVSDAIGIAWAVMPPRLLGVVAVATPLALTSRLHMTRRALPLVVTAGLGEVAGYASYAVGARHSLAVSAVLSSQFAAIAAFVGFLLFHERLGRVQVAGVVAIIAGVSALSVLHG